MLHSNPWRKAIHRFIAERLQTKLEAVEKDKKLEPFARFEKSASLRADYEPSAWLQDAATRARQIQLATHTLKPIHPDAKGSQLYSPGNPLAPTNLLGSHGLSSRQRPLDVIGNAAALDVFKFLKITQEGSARTLLEALQADDPEALIALDNQPEAALALAKALLAVTQPKDAPASHTLGKQLYFPTSEGDHLLAPLYPTQLVHAVHQHLQETRFGDAPKASREARKKGELAAPYREYPSLLAQAFGGTKPQNISQLNSERGGKGYLFASLPPSARSYAGPPYYQESVFAANGAFAKRKDVRQTLTTLRDFLHQQRQRGADSRGGNLETRDFRAEQIGVLVDSLLDFTSELRELEPGWSADPRCQLPVEQCYAFDPLAEGPKRNADPHFLDDEDESVHETPESHWPRMVARQFASFLAKQLSTKENLMADAEHQEWWRSTRKKLISLQKELSDVA